MVSDHPLPDRCGARVVDKIGLEIELEDDVTLTDEQIDAVIISKCEARVVAEPNYKHVREYLWDDYSPTIVGVSETTELVGAQFEEVDDPDTEGQAGSPDTEDVIWLDISEVVENTTNRTSELKGYCERYQMNDKDRCYVHQGGEAKKGNTNAMKHGLYAQRTNYYQALDDEDKEFVEAMVDSWLDRAPFERDDVGMVNDLYRCAIDQHRAWGGLDELVEGGEIEGMTKEQIIGVDDSGRPVEVVDEHPVNLPYSRLDGDVRAKLKELGIYESPEKQQADATQSLAKKLSGMTDE